MHICLHITIKSVALKVSLHIGTRLLAWHLHIKIHIIDYKFIYFYFSHITTNILFDFY